MAESKIAARSEGGRMKPSARRALFKSDALYLSSLDLDGLAARRQFERWRAVVSFNLDLNGLPAFTCEDIPQLVERIRSFTAEWKPAFDRQDARAGVL